MSARSLLRLGLVLWTIAFVVSFLDFRLFDPSGEAFTSQVSQMWKFLLWQGIAAILAIALWVVGTQFVKGSAQRVASRVPGVLLIAILVAFGLFMLTARAVGSISGDAAPPVRVDHVHSA